MLSIRQLLNHDCTEDTTSDSTVSSVSTVDSPSSSTSIFPDSSTPTTTNSKPHSGRIMKIFKGPWRPSETALLARLVSKYGPRNWCEIADSIPGRTGKQARERWKNHLDPRLKKGSWTTAEDATIARAFRLHGNKWSAIARLIPGRSDNDVKNRFNCAIRSRINLPPPQPSRKLMQSSSSVSSKQSYRPPIIVPKALQWELDPHIKPPTMFSIFE